MEQARVEPADSGLEFYVDVRLGLASLRTSAVLRFGPEAIILRMDGGRFLRLPRDMVRQVRPFEDIANPPGSLLIDHVTPNVIVPLTVSPVGATREDLLAAFRRFGFPVGPAPKAFRAPRAISVLLWMVFVSALVFVYFALLRAGF